jgi:ligand-binding SRPBCC domain-containing protein
MVYQHSFTIRSTLSTVRDFHVSSSSMATITPPPVIVRVREAPRILGEGDEMDFTLWLLFLPVRWVARIESVTPNGFTDRQLSGPFNTWIHRHTFIERSTETVEVQDEVQASLSSNPFWWLVGAGMWLSMPILFAYRGWKTRRVLEK